jgi:hypothetical protein
MYVYIYNIPGAPQATATGASRTWQTANRGLRGETLCYHLNHNPALLLLRNLRPIITYDVYPVCTVDINTVL